MNKVLIDRELLLQLFRCWDCGLEVDNELAQLRIAAAQPAEAEGVEVRCDICGGTGAADSGGVQPWGEAIYVDCECIAKQEQFAGKLGALKKAAKGACSYSEEDWFRPENLWSCMEKDDAAFVSAASPFALLALIAAYERISAALSAVTAERDRFKELLREVCPQLCARRDEQDLDDAQQYVLAEECQELIDAIDAAMAAKEA